MKKIRPGTIGIIGFGRFGRCLCQLLKKDFRIVVFSKPKPKDFRQNSQIKWGGLKEVANCKVIILAVPISVFEEVLKEISPYLKKDSLIIDVCSVKKYPAELMEKILPKNAEILATHPLFGPDSLKEGLEGSKIVLWPVRLKKEKYNQIKKWLKKKGLNTIEISPREHDKLMAGSQALTHFIGRILETMKTSTTPIDTPSFQKLLQIKEIVQKDNLQLFKDIQKFNPYTKKMRQYFKRALQKIEKMIENKKNNKGG